MSLKEAYSLAHSAQCRLNIEANRPDRNLRFVVGHLMHYEHLRLRIVEIEHDISKSERAKAVAFQGTGHVEHHLQHKPSTGQLWRRSPPPPAAPEYDGEDHDNDDGQFDDAVDGLEDEEGLGLTRFPSGSARPPQPPPDLEPENPNDPGDDDEEPVSPQEPDQATLEAAMRAGDNGLYATIYNSMKKCSCHGKTNAPSFERMWELPKQEGKAKDGVTWAVAEVRAEEAV